MLVEILNQVVKYSNRYFQISATKFRIIEISFKLYYSQILENLFKELKTELPIVNCTNLNY